MVFSMYRPIAQGDVDGVCALLSLLLISAFLCAATLAFSLCNTVRVVMAIHVYGKYSLFLLAGVTGSMGIALGMMLLERVAGSLAKPLSWLGRHSLFVFASHHIAFQMMNDLLRCLSIDGPNLLMYQLIYTALAILLCSAVCRITVGFVPALEGK